MSASFRVQCLTGLAAVARERGFWNVFTCLCAVVVLPFIVSIAFGKLVHWLILGLSGAGRALWRRTPTPLLWLALGGTLGFLARWPAAALSESSQIAPTCPLSLAAPQSLAEALRWVQPVSGLHEGPAAVPPAAVSDLWSWRAASRPRRTLLLLSALHAPRTGCLLTLSRGDAGALGFLLAHPQGDGQVASATLRCAVSWLLAPRLALAALCLRSRRGANGTLALCVAAWALLRAALDLLALQNLLLFALARPGATAEAALARAFSRFAALMLMSLVLPWLPNFVADLALLVDGGAITLWEMLQEARPWVKLASMSRSGFAQYPTMQNTPFWALGAAMSQIYHEQQHHVHGHHEEEEYEEEEESEEEEAPRTREAVHFPPPLQLPAMADTPSFPAHLRCPITLNAMSEPAVSPAGITYERAALLRWVRDFGTEPQTRRRMSTHQVLPNLCARAAIEGWCAAQARRRAARVRSKDLPKEPACEGKQQPEDPPSPPLPPPPPDVPSVEPTTEMTHSARAVLSGFTPEAQFVFRTGEQSNAR